MNMADIPAAQIAKLKREDRYSGKFFVGPKPGILFKGTYPDKLLSSAAKETVPIKRQRRSKTNKEVMYFFCFIFVFQG
jgi:hypothetical protein